jgi:hypothetical protein
VPFLVDGDNLLGTWPGRERNDRERRAVASEVARALRGRRAIVVFDGAARDAHGFPGEVRFSGARKTADEVILRFLETESERSAWIVVTSDRSLGDRCRHLGARVERCDRFRPRLRARGPGEKPERVEDLEGWLAEFGEPLSEASPRSPRRPPRVPPRGDDR